MITIRYIPNPGCAIRIIKSIRIYSDLGLHAAKMEYDQCRASFINADLALRFIKDTSGYLVITQAEGIPETFRILFGKDWL